MKRNLSAAAFALAGLSSAASAQSVLERVLSQIDNTASLVPVTGTFANIAENIGTVGTQTFYVDAQGNTISQQSYVAAVADKANANLDNIFKLSWAYMYTDTTGNPHFYPDLATATAAAAADAQTYYQSLYNPVQVGLSSSVDGSINNLITALTQSTQMATAGAATATEWGTPTVNIGDLGTTALGAVNTGDITLGVNGSINDAKTSAAQATSTTMDQIGGSADTGALVLNVASNMTGVNGSITNTMSGVTGSIGAASTTALGAVNTGTITVGVNAAVQGIVGASGQ